MSREFGDEDWRDLPARKTASSSPDAPQKELRRPFPDREMQEDALFVQRTRKALIDLIDC